MQVLTMNCPYCKKQVDGTIDQAGGPIICPHCDKPFEMEMPTAIVSAVEEITDDAENQNRIATEPEERTLARIHPVIFRSRPAAALGIFILGVASIILIVLSFTGTVVAGVALNDTPVLGPASLLMWVCAAILLAIAVTIGYWTLLSRFTTLTVTDDRTIYKEGIISRDTSEVQHDDVRNIQLDQTIMQRWLNVGGIGISSSGQDDLEVVAKRLPDPSGIIKLIRQNQS
ncbi:MAG: PH domain-containing protein [Pirellulaceae bacterium]